MLLKVSLVERATNKIFPVVAHDSITARPAQFQPIPGLSEVPGMVPTGTPGILLGVVIRSQAVHACTAFQYRGGLSSDGVPSGI